MSGRGLGALIAVNQPKARKWVAAWSGALALHGLFAIFLFGTLSGGGIRGVRDPFGEGEALEVTLSGFEGVRGASSSTPQPAASAPLEALAQRLQARSPVPTLPYAAEAGRSGDVASLFDGDKAGWGRGEQGAGADAAGSAASGGRETRTAQSSLRGDRGAAASSGDFVGQVEACWRSLPLRSSTLVALEVVINEKGRLAAKPTILRPAGARLDEARLTAEATALRAIQTCLPAKSPPMPGVQKSYRLTFDPARHKR